MKYRNTILDPVTLLMKGPRTVHELSEILGNSHNGVTLWLRKLKAYGLVYVCTHHGRKKVWAWQPTPFHHEDCPRLTPYQEFLTVRAEIEGRE